MTLYLLFFPSLVTALPTLVTDGGTTYEDTVQLETAKVIESTGEDAMMTLEFRSPIHRV